MTCQFKKESRKKSVISVSLKGYYMVYCEQFVKTWLILQLDSVDFKGVCVFKRVSTCLADFHCKQQFHGGECDMVLSAYKYRSR